MSLPWKVTVPETARSSPEIVRSVVVLPAPLAPINVTIERDGTWKLIPLIAPIAP